MQSYQSRAGVALVLLLELSQAGTVAVAGGGGENWGGEVPWSMGGKGAVKFLPDSGTLEKSLAAVPTSSSKIGDTTIDTTPSLFPPL